MGPKSFCKYSRVSSLQPLPAQKITNTRYFHLFRPRCSNISLSPCRLFQANTGQAAALNSSGPQEQPEDAATETRICCANSIYVFESVLMKSALFSQAISAH